MRSVVLLAILWQTAVVVGLGAIHAPNNNSGGSTAHPWIGTRMWSTSIETFVSLDLLFSPQTVHWEIFIKGLHNQDSTTASAVALNPRDGKVQWREDDIPGFLATSWFASQFPYVAAETANGVSLLMFNKSAQAVERIRTYPLSPSTPVPGPIFELGGQFLWITGVYSQTGNSPISVTKIDPKSGASSTFRTSLSTFEYVASAGLNYLFGSNGNTVDCFSAATGKSVWLLVVAGDVFKVSPSPHNDIFLVFFSNASASLFNAANDGELIWTADGLLHGTPSDPLYSLDVFFTTDFVLLRENFGQLTAVDLSIGKKLWSDASQSEDDLQLNCILESGVFVYLVQHSPSPYSVIGVDLKTGNGMFNYTIDLSDAIHASNSQFSSPHIYCDGRADVYFSVVSNVNNSVVQHLAFNYNTPGHT